MKHFFGKLLSTLVITSLTVYMGSVLIKQETKLKTLESEIKQYETLLGDAKMETESLKETKSKVNTDEYIEKYAREKLGLVMPYETIFVDANI